MVVKMVEKGVGVEPRPTNSFKTIRRREHITVWNQELAGGHVATAGTLVGIIFGQYFGVSLSQSVYHGQYSMTTITPPVLRGRHMRICEAGSSRRRRRNIRVRSCRATARAVPPFCATPLLDGLREGVPLGLVSLPWAATRS